MPCIINPCNPPLDHRQLACETYYKNTYRSSSSSYINSVIPAPSTDNKKCDLRCRRGAKKPIEETNQGVPNGTPCSYDEPHSYCLLGLCYNVGCDNVMNSGKRFNKCGMCGIGPEHCSFEQESKKKVNNLTCQT